MRQYVDLVELRGKVYLHRVYNGRRECLAQHTFTNVRAMQAWLQGVGGRPVGKVGSDGVSGRYEVEVRNVRWNESDEQQHIQDDLSNIVKGL